MSENGKQPTGAETIAWDLTDLYAGLDDPKIELDLQAAEAAADALDRDYRGRIASLSPEELGEMLAAYEGIEDRAGKVGAFAYLYWASDTGDPQRGALLQRATERGSRLNQKLVFLELELVHAPDDVAAKWLAHKGLRQYRHWLEQLRRYQPHLLSEPEEKILSEKAVTGRNAWDRFFDEVHGAARYDLDGEKLTRDQVLSRLYSPDREARRVAAAAVTAGLQELRRTNTYVFNTILADKASDDRLRNYATWISARNIANEVADETVEALIQAVTSRYDIVERYYRLKKSLLGLDELYDYDRYAPLPAADRRYTWDEAREIVLNAYAQFHPRMAEVARRFFEEQWIDAAVRPGKLGGAFSHGVVPSVHPYVLMNYEGMTRDVMTLAHELGHGVHQSLAGVQGTLQHRTPLTTAETASVFGEMLVFQDLVAAESDPAVRLAMLTSKLEDSFATAFRQIAMNRFENAIHTARRERRRTDRRSGLASCGWTRNRRCSATRSSCATNMACGGATSRTSSACRVTSTPMRLASCSCWRCMRSTRKWGPISRRVIWTCSPQAVRTGRMRSSARWEWISPIWSSGTRGYRSSRTW